MLRTLRLRLKAFPAPAPDPATDALRNDIKRAELAAERIALASLERLAAPWLAAGDPAQAATAATHNLAAAFAVTTGHAADLRADTLLHILAQAGLA